VVSTIETLEIEQTDGGRLLLKKRERRNRQLNIRITESEQLVMKSLAEKHDMSMTEFITALIHHAETRAI